MRLTHPFGEFVPPQARYLILGSFPAKEAGDWFYGSDKNQFWKILSRVYGRELNNKNQKKRLCGELKIALGDVIAQCRRDKNSSLDVNLKELILNQDGVEKVLKNNKIIRIFFTSRWVEKVYRTKFRQIIENYQEIELVGLPSPSPRYCQKNLEEKVRIYKEVLPELKV